MKPQAGMKHRGPAGHSRVHPRARGSEPSTYKTPRNEPKETVQASERAKSPRFEAPRFVLHVDADAFYASVEQALHPELKGKPVIVGGRDRGGVSAASYEARTFGIHSAMPTVQARRLCPKGVFLKLNFTAYKDFSLRMFAIIRQYSPIVEATSIDEGYVDLTGTLRLHNAPPWEIAHRIINEIRSALGINCSGGLAGGKTAAKMATSLAKPNGLLYLEPDRAFAILGNLPVGKIPGVGRKAQDKLYRNNIKTVRDLASAQPRSMTALLGRHGPVLMQKAAGNDNARLRPEPRESQKSYSMDRTLAKDTTNIPFLRALAKRLAETLAAKVRADAAAAATVTLKIRYADFTDVSKSVTMRQAVNGNKEILACVDELFPRAVTRIFPIRQVGVKLSGIQAPVFQSELFDPFIAVRTDLDRARDRIRDKFGFDAVLVSGCGPHANFHGERGHNE